MAFHVEHVAAFPGLAVVTPDRFDDPRGYFSETYQKTVLAAHGITCDFIQDNQSLSRPRGTVRGLHFQAPPFAQAKLVRALAGSIVDVVVDIRKGSPAFGRAFAVELSDENGKQLFVPEGYAHGFCTLTPDALVVYKVSAPYSREHDGGIFWDDPALGIDWPVATEDALLSEKDRQLPLLSALDSPFSFEGQTA